MRSLIFMIISACRLTDRISDRILRGKRPQKYSLYSEGRFILADSGITTKEQAKQQSRSYNKNCYTVLNAFGIKNRGPAASEVSYIQKWTDTYGFTLDIIEERLQAEQFLQLISQALNMQTRS